MNHIWIKRKGRSPLFQFYDLLEKYLIPFSEKVPFHLKKHDHEERRDFKTLILASDGPMTSVKKLYSRNHGGMKRVSTFVNYQLVKNYMLNVKTIYIYP